MDFLGPQAVTSIAKLLGIETRQVACNYSLPHQYYLLYLKDDEKYEPESVEVGGERDEEVSKYLIRQGADKDVLQGSVRRCQDNLDSIEKEICSDYTYADYKEEFERERSAEELYEDDIRAPVESEITEGQTYQAGRLPDKKFVLVNIPPRELDIQQYSTLQQ